MTLRALVRERQPTRTPRAVVRFAPKRRFDHRTSFFYLFPCWLPVMPRFRFDPIPVGPATACFLIRSPGFDSPMAGRTNSRSVRLRDVSGNSGRRDRIRFGSRNRRFSEPELSDSNRAWRRIQENLAFSAIRPNEAGISKSPMTRFDTTACRGMTGQRKSVQHWAGFRPKPDFRSP